MPTVTPPSPLVAGLFETYLRSYLRRHFHHVRLSRADRPLLGDDEPLIVYLNHPSWWDPLVAFMLARRNLRDREHFAPIDAVALRKYPFFARLGFFGVEQDSGGMRTFLRGAREVLQRPASALWVTPQGRFTDAYRRPLELKPGLGALVSRLDRGVVLPLALEYTWWEERKPEALARFGVPFRLEREWRRAPAEWSQLLAGRLAETADVLREEALSRDPGLFSTVVGGRSGVGGVYDLWRGLGSLLRGERFRAEHGGIGSGPADRMGPESEAVEPETAR
jgi:1-acyl-sn-glycerol-3-phosphate acyltransferase